MLNKLHYQGDCRDFVPNRVVGPDCWGAWYLPVSAHFFDGVTTMFFKPVPPDQLPPECIAMSKMVVEQQQRGKVQTWPQRESTHHENGSHEFSPNTRLPNSLRTSQTSRRSGGQKKPGASAGSGLTRSQRKLLKRFRKPDTR